MACQSPAIREPAVNGPLVCHHSHAEGGVSQLWARRRRAKQAARQVMDEAAVGETAVGEAADGEAADDTAAVGEAAVRRSGGQAVRRSMKQARQVIRLPRRSATITPL